MNDDEDDEGRVGSSFIPAANAPAEKPGAPRKDPTYAMSSMKISRDGLAFIVAREGPGSNTDTVHWPGGGSGVTLGYGYDFGERTGQTIIRDLTSIGVSPKVAELMSLGAGLFNSAAQKFVKNNAKFISLSNYQKEVLLGKTIGEYENRIKNSASFRVTQYQFDALVSLAYDSGKHLSHVTRAIAAGRLADAEKDWLSRTHEGSVYKPGLANRRKMEVNLYNNGIYK